MIEFGQALATIQKDDPTVDGVHVTSAGGNGKAKKKPPFWKRGDVDFEFTLEILKDANGKPAVNESQRLVFGWASVIEENGKIVTDSQGDQITEAELEKAFYDFAENARQADEMHDESLGGPMVECMVFTKEKQALLGIDLKKVGAWIGFRVRDDIFAKVKSGDYAAFSIGGRGRRSPL